MGQSSLRSSRGTFRIGGNRPAGVAPKGGSNGGCARGARTARASLRCQRTQQYPGGGNRRGESKNWYARNFGSDAYSSFCEDVRYFKSACFRRRSRINFSPPVHHGLQVMFCVRSFANGCVQLACALVCAVEVLGAKVGSPRKSVWAGRPCIILF